MRRKRHRKQPEGIESRIITTVLVVSQALQNSGLVDLIGEQLLHLRAPVERPGGGSQRVQVRRLLAHGTSVRNHHCQYSYFLIQTFWPIRP